MDRRTIRRLASAAAVLTLGGVGYSAIKRRGNGYYNGPVSDHFDGVRFYRAGFTADKTPKDILRWRRESDRAAWPASYPSSFSDEPPPSVDGIRVTLVGHASLLVQVCGINILVDPVWSDRASPFRFAGPRRVNPPGIAFGRLPRIDAVLVTHNHYDHLDVTTIGALWDRFHPLVVAPLGNDAIIRSYDDGIEVTTLDWGQSVRLGRGVTAHLEPANHWSARWINDRRMALWGAYALTTPAGLVYLAGDTGYGSGDTFRRIRAGFGEPRIAALPIGAYEPRWFMGGQHMNPSDAVMAFEDLGAEAAIGMHWGTFQLTDEAVDQPVRDLAAALDAAAIDPARFRAFRPGEVWTDSAAD